ncbi:MAG: hypothetical protein U0359_22300 [Byssovorax sp.]
MRPRAAAPRVSLAFLLATIATAPAGSRPARADDVPPPPPPAAPAPAASCSVRGTEPVTKGAQIFDAPAGGRVIALFTGADLALSLRDFPSDPTTGRTRVSTGGGAASFRIEGFAAASAFTVHAARDLPAAGSAVSIATAASVRLVGAAGATLTAEHTILGSPGQTVRATAPCDAFALGKGTPIVLDVPPNGRAYTMKGTSLDLHESPGGAPVFTLKTTEGASHLFWSPEARGAFVHVKLRADIAVDAWAPLRDLSPLRKGEMMDALDTSSTLMSSVTLGLDKPPRIVVLAHDQPIRARRDDKESPIGVIEAGAEVYLVETVAGWANVLPKHLALTPPDDGGFWFPAADLPR